MDEFSLFEAVGELSYKGKYALTKTNERYFMGVIAVNDGNRLKSFGFVAFKHLADRFQKLNVGQKIFVKGSVESKEVVLPNNTRKFELSIIINQMYPISLNPTDIKATSKKVEPIELVNSNLLGEC